MHTTTGVECDLKEGTTTIPYRVVSVLGNGFFCCKNMYLRGKVASKMTRIYSGCSLSTSLQKFFL